MIEPPEPLRIFYLVNAFESDAPTRLVLQLAVRLQSEGAADCLIAALSRDGVLREAVETAAVKATLINMRSASDVAGAYRLGRVIRRFRPHVFHASLTRPTIVGIPISCWAGVPCRVATHHGSHEWEEKGASKAAVVPAMYRFAAKRADRLIAVSDAVAEQLVEAGISSGNIVRIHNGVDPEEFHPDLRRERGDLLYRLFGEDQEKPLLVCAAGNLRPVKGHWDLVQAASRLYRVFPQVRFVIFGEGPERPRLEQEIERLRLEKVFLLPGRAEHLARYVAACDVFVQPSHEEAFGLAVAEAMSCGVPVVAAATGGLKDLVESGVTGLLFQPGSADELAARVGDLLLNPRHRKAYGDAARQRVLNRFTLQQMTTSHLQLYRDLMRR